MTTTDQAPPATASRRAGKKFRVILDSQERQQLQQLLARDAVQLRLRTHAQILLLADEGPAGPAWDDRAIARSVGVGLATVPRVRERFVVEGLAMALQSYRKGTRTYPTALDEVQEARLVDLAGTTPPDGSTRWTCRALARRMMELNYVGRISHETVRQCLKRANPRQHTSNDV
jgi:transposase